VNWQPVTTPEMIPRLEGRQVTFGNKVIALFNLGNEFVAVGSQCPHKEGPLADGIVCGKTVTCPLHNWVIDLESGSALNGEEGKVEVYPTRIIDGKVCIAFDGGK